MLDYLFTSIVKGTSLVDIFAVIFAGAAFMLSVIQFVKDNSRQKRESTLNAYSDLQDDVFTNLNILLSEYEIEKKKLSSLRTGDKEWEEITGYLAKIERFSVGINSRIYSINVLNRLGGGYFIRLYRELSPVIEKKRKADKSKGNHYDEFEATVKKLEKMRKVKELIAKLTYTRY